MSHEKDVIQTTWNDLENSLKSRVFGGEKIRAMPKGEPMARHLFTPQAVTQIPSMDDEVFYVEFHLRTQHCVLGSYKGVSTLV